VKPITTDESRAINGGSPFVFFISPKLRLPPCDEVRLPVERPGDWEIPTHV